MEDWFIEHEEKLKITSLVVASLVLLISIYRWLLQKWRADVSLRRYAYFQSLPDQDVGLSQMLKVDLPIDQEVELTLINANGQETTLFKGQAESGLLEVELDMSIHEQGDYELIMKTMDQTAIKTIKWSGRN
jgi:hypothetical protein